MKRAYIFLALFVSIALTTIIYYTSAVKDKPDTWKLIPGNALVAFEWGRTTESFNELVQRPVWKSLQYIPEFKAFENGIAMLDSISGNDGTLDRLFKNNVLISSMHIVSSADFGFVHYLDLDENGGEKNLSKIISALEKSPYVKYNTRIFRDFEIHEITHNRSHQSYSLMIYKNIAVLSATAFLVEDVIRNIEDKFATCYYDRMTSLHSIAKLSDDDGDIYIDMQSVPALIGIFTETPDDYLQKMIGSMGNDTYYDLKATDNEILLNGAFTLQANGKDFLSTFAEQPANKIGVMNMVPDETSVMYNVTFSNFTKWHQKLTRYRQQTLGESLEMLINYEEVYGQNLDWIDNEIALTTQHGFSTEENGKVLFLKAKDPQKALDQMLAFTNKINADTGDSLYSEAFSGLNIYQLSVEEWPAVTLGKIYQGFQNSWFTAYNGYVLVGNSAVAIKNVLKKVESEATWGKSVRHNLFFDNIYNEANVTLIINTNMLWGEFINVLSPKWKAHFEGSAVSFKSFDLMAFQVNNLEQKYFSTIAIGHQKNAQKPVPVSKYQKFLSTYTMSPITTKPYMVTNHNNRKLETLVQDSLHILYLMSSDGEVLWGDSIGQKIRTDIFQIDYFNNGKLQYLFATDNKLHVLDRNGDYVENYPITTQGFTPAFLSVIDYDHNKKYRFMLADGQGRLWLYNKEGQLLEGWKPRLLDGPLSTAPEHIRVKGGDCFIALQSNGTINLINRRGENYNGFPLKLGEAVTGPYFVKMGNDFTSTIIITVTDGGEVIQVNLKGQVVKREQLTKASKESHFWLVPEAQQKTYVIARQDYGRVTFLTADGKDIFMQDYLSVGQLATQFYNFGPDQSLYIIVDAEQEFTYLYNEKGKLVSHQPVETGFPLALMYFASDNTYRVYKTYHNTFTGFVLGASGE